MQRVTQGLFSAVLACSGMSRRLFTRQTLTCRRLRPHSANAGQRLYSRYEPDGLDDGPEIPEYECLNIQMRSYDYVKLEAYTKFVHRQTERFDIDSECYPAPARTAKIQTFKPNSSILLNDYNLAMCERIVQISDVPSTKIPLFFEVLHQHLPSGVTVDIKEPDPDEEEFRYLPDREIEELKGQLHEISKAKDDRRKK